MRKTRSFFARGFHFGVLNAISPSYVLPASPLEDTISLRLLYVWAHGFINWLR
jgi:hypothetical protein